MKNKIYRYITSVLAILIFCAVIVWFTAAVDSAGSATRTGQLDAVRQSVESSITLCYSIEGAYPESLEYLTENYGLNYDSDRYIIHYDCFAANIRPSVTIVERES
ncbi:MAG: hypothetical protein IJY73_05535 [Oscillospiraceae bacterium]|nr:hypothetical protein [Oscillospiraceae bacterium]